MKYTICPPNLIEYVWHDVEQYVQNTADVSNSEFSAESIKIGLINGQQLLGLVTEHEEIVAIFTMEKKVFDTGLTALYVPIIAGTRVEDWFDEAIDFAAMMAENMGATELRGLSVRKGWSRFLHKRGDWKDVHTVLSLQLGEDNGR